MIGKGKSPDCQVRRGNRGEGEENSECHEGSTSLILYFNSRAAFVTILHPQHLCSKEGKLRR